MSTPLSSKQRAHLRGLGHSLKPIVHVGKEGVTESVLTSVRQAFSTHELLKMRVLENAPDGPRETAHLIADAIENTSVVQTVGYTAVIYRPDPDSPTIELPT